ncbi:MAG: hypothetical protein EAX86_05445 [Candidatus Heimdallarchaeota archaeon]|nr:hypothetical protein [Candidatus Heimdallarchaeota archaeon]
MHSTRTHPHYKINGEKIDQKIDVRSKILSIFMIVLICSFLVNFYQLLCFSFIFLVYTILLRPKPSFIKYLLLSLPIILSLTLISFFSFSSAPILYRTFFFSTTHNNLSFAVFSGFRSLLIVSFVLMMIHSEESFFEIIYGLDDLRMPDLLTNLTFLTYRFLFLMEEEFRRILEARSNRLYGTPTKMSFSSLKILGNIIGSVLARSFRRAEYVSATLAARGFSSSSKMSHPEQPWTLHGCLLMLLTLILISTTLIIK